jgi:hypothetical protein
MPCPCARSKKVLRLWYDLGLLQSEIARSCCISQSSVNQYLFSSGPELVPEQPCAAASVTCVPAGLNLKPCANTFSLASAVSVDISPTVALVAEAIPTPGERPRLGDPSIHRPSYAFGIQKKIWGHAFTQGSSDGPATIVSQPAGTRATFLGDPTADKPGVLFLGFDLTRQVS